MGGALGSWPTSPAPNRASWPATVGIIATVILVVLVVLVVSVFSHQLFIYIDTFILTLNFVLKLKISLSHYSHNRVSKALY